MTLYNLHIPEQQSCPLVVSIPHSGRMIPDSIRSQFIMPCPPLANMDWYLDKLYSFLPGLGIPVLQANYSRYIIDLSRDLRPPLLGSYSKAAVYTQNTFGTSLYDELPNDEEV